jgi:hypothetical protein
MSVVLPGVFYVDGRGEGVSSHLLNEIGVTLTRAADRSDTTVAGMGAIASESWTPFSSLYYLEHAFNVAVVFEAKGSEGAALVLDVRDAADAYVRIVALVGDVVALAAGVNHRLVAAGTPVAPAPVFPANADRSSKQNSVIYSAAVDEPKARADPLLRAPTGTDLKYGSEASICARKCGGVCLPGAAFRKAWYTRHPVARC